MGKPRLKAKAFGTWIARARGERSREEIAASIRDVIDRTGMKVNRSAIMKIEAGRVPNVLVLYGLSRALPLPLDEMVRRILKDLGVRRRPQRIDFSDLPDTTDAQLASMRRDRRTRLKTTRPSRSTR